MCFIYFWTPEIALIVLVEAENTSEPEGEAQL